MDSLVLLVSLHALLHALLHTNHLLELDKQPVKAQEGPVNLVDMGEYKLEIKSNVRRGVHALIAVKLPPQKEEYVEEDGEENPLSSNEDVVEE